MPQQPTNDVQTISITNFKGSLTRYVDGDMNSGMAKFSTSFGYDPFSKPGNLTWLKAPLQINNTLVTDALLAMSTYTPSTSPFSFAVGSSGNFYQIDATNVTGTNNPLNDVASVLSNIGTGSVGGAFTRGAYITPFNSKLYVSSDNTVLTINIDGSGAASIAGASSVTGGLYHPMLQFGGSLYVANGNNIMQIDSTNSIINGAKLSPALPSGTYIHDLDITPDGNYMIITASYIPNDNISDQVHGGDKAPYGPGSFLFLWNGSDLGVTAEIILPAFPASALQTFLDKRYAFLNDGFGLALFEGTNKILTLPNNLYPMANATDANGTFLTWACPETTGGGSPTNSYASIYYYGYLDGENQPGLWRIVRQSIAAGTKQVWRVPMNKVINNFIVQNLTVYGWGKHYFSVWAYDTVGKTSSYYFYRLTLPPSTDLSVGPALGVYETQNQIFSKKITVKQIRVYCEPTVANNGFQLDLIGSDGNIISNSWNTNTYTYAAGTDPTLLQGSLERIDFTPVMKNTYSLGLRITNTGIVNMTIHKIEIDWAPAGK